MTTLEFKINEFGRRFPRAVEAMLEIVTLAAEDAVDAYKQEYAYESFGEDD